MTTRNEKIDEIVSDLNNASFEVIDSRLNTIKEIELFEDTFQHLCAPLYIDYGSGQNLHNVTLELSKIRANCLGASSGDVLYYDLNSSSSYSSLTNFSFPSLITGTNSKPKFVVLIKDIDNTYSISLNNTSGSTETSIQSDGTSNTYSNYIGDYYFVRSRETGNLLDFTSNNTAFVNPSASMVFGNTVSFGDSVVDEEGNWNELFAYANIGSVEFNSTGDQFVTLSHDLDQGSDGITTKPPIVGRFLGLKRFEPVYENITITGNSVIDLLSNTASDRLLSSNSSLVNIGAELSHSDWSSNLTVTAINTDDNVIILSSTLDLIFTDTEIQVKNLIEDEHSLFALAQVVTEGMQPNPNWKPTGDNDAVYSAVNESPTETTLLDNTGFESRLPKFVSPYGNMDLFKSADPELLSSGNEVGQHSGNYPNVELNPFNPAVEGARNEYGTDTGVQPQSMGMNDIFVGRFVKYDENRKDNSGTNIGDYRYMVDAAAKFFYLPNPLQQVQPTIVTEEVENSNNTHTWTETVVTTFQVSPTTIPQSGAGRGEEPLAKYADGRTTILTSAIERVRGDLNDVINSSAPLSVSSTSGYAQNAKHPNNGTVPSGFPYSWGDSNAPVGNTHVYNNSSGSSANPPTVTILYLNSNDKIETHQFNHNVSPNIDTSTGQITNYTHALVYLISETSCRYNDLRNNVYSTSDYQYVKSKISALDSLASYRDPIMEISGGIEYSSSKKSAAEEFDNSIGNCDLDINDVDGDSTQYNTNNYDGATFSISNVQDLYSSLLPANTSITNRITELNSRIGEPTYTGSQSGDGTLPAIRVSAIPAKSATSLAPYGRSIYEVVNLSLGNDINLISNVVDEVDAIDFRYKSIRDKRNQFDILNGRGKYYGS
jgi:hypothetical protein